MLRCCCSSSSPSIPSPSIPSLAPAAGPQATISVALGQATQDLQDTVANHPDQKIQDAFKAATLVNGVAADTATKKAGLIAAAAALTAAAARYPQDVLLQGRAQHANDNVDKHASHAPKSQCCTYTSFIAATVFATVVNAFYYNSIANISHEIVNIPLVPELNMAKQWEIKTFAALTPLAIAGTALIFQACRKALPCMDKPRNCAAHLCNVVSLTVPTIFAAMAVTPYLLNPLNELVNASGHFTDFDTSGHLTMKLMTVPLALAAYSHLKSTASKAATIVGVGLLASDLLFLAQTNAYHHQPAEMIAAGVVGAAAMSSIAAVGAGIYYLANRCCKFA